MRFPWERQDAMTRVVCAFPREHWAVAYEAAKRAELKFSPYAGVDFETFIRTACRLAIIDYKRRTGNFLRKSKEGEVRFRVGANSPIVEKCDRSGAKPIASDAGHGENVERMHRDSMFDALIPFLTERQREVVRLVRSASSQSEARRLVPNLDRELAAIVAAVRGDAPCPEPQPTSRPRPRRSRSTTRPTTADSPSPSVSSTTRARAPRCS